MRMLLIGANSFVGKRIARYFSGRCELIATYHKKKNEDIADQLQLDLTVKDDVKNALAKIKPDIIVVTAAISTNSETNESINKVNLDGISNITASIEELNLKTKIIFFSTEQVFDGEKGMYSEEDQPSPINNYGRSKAEGEQLIRACQGCSHIILRCVLIIGSKEKDDHDNFLTMILDAGKEKEKPLRIFRDAFRTTLFVEDIPTIIDKLIRKGFCGTINLSNQSYLSYLEMAQSIERIFGVKKEYDVVGCNVLSIPKKLGLKNDLLMKETGFRPTGFEEMIMRIKKDMDLNHSRGNAEPHRTDHPGNGIKLPALEAEKSADQIGNFLIKKILELKLTGAVVGLSGGVDSTTTAALAKRAIDKYNNGNYANKGRKLELVGYILPSKTNDPADALDGLHVAEKLGIRHEVHGIEPVLQAFHTTNPEAFKNQYDRGNLASRVRSNILNTKAATENKILLGTGNKDEDFGIGYYTLFGDGAVHISIIGGLSKRLVRKMAAYLGFPELANRVPTAGLEPGQTDFKDLGYSYDFVELVLEGLQQGIPEEMLYAQPQVKAMSEDESKEYRRLFGKTKFDDGKGAVADVLRRHNEIAKGKEQIIHPPIAPVDLHYPNE